MAKKPKPLPPVICQECRKEAWLCTGLEIYPHRPDLHGRHYWKCDCGAYVGCHPGTKRALGTPAGAETRAARSDAHAAFDPLWKRKSANTGLAMGHCRAKGYRWLSEQLGLPAEITHISMMDAATARRVVALCSSRGRGFR